MRVTPTLGAALAAATLGLAACSGGGGVSSAQAADTPSADAMVTAVGCPKTPKPNCVTVTADGKTWDVTAAGVDLSRGVAVSVTGAPSAMSDCGKVLAQPQVDYTGLQCPKT
jgi:hypothetical protein